MTYDEEQQIKEHLQAVAEILYKNTDSTKLKSFENLEIFLRQQILKEVIPELARFFFQKSQASKQAESEK